MIKCARCSLLAILLVLVLSSCINIIPNQQPVSQPTVTPTVATSYSLRALAQAHGLLIGTAVNTQAFQSDVQYKDTLGNEFNYMVPETSLEFMYAEPTPNVYDFQDTDSFLAFAQAHDMQMRGHALIWPHQPDTLPDWLNKGKFSNDQIKTILQDYITTLVSHYRGKIDVWDVLNEAVDAAGSLINCIWLQALGPDYIDWIFKWAHAADPKALLFYNDYSAEDMGVKSTAIYNLVKGMLQRGVPISGVGFEMHVDSDTMPKLQAMQANMARLGALGLQVNITEMDVRTWDASGSTAQKLATEAQIYHNVLAVCLQAENCKRFLMWGFTDRYTWIPSFTGHPDIPLIFDKSYQPKPAYYALINAFTESSMHLLS